MDQQGNSFAEPVASTEAAESKPKICKLNINCFETIFDYLSLGDLSAFSQTCKLMQKVSGRVLRSKYQFLRVFIDEYGDCLSGDRFSKQINLNMLREYIELLTIDTDINTISLSQWQQFKSVKYICFCSTKFSGTEMQMIESILKNVNAVELSMCEFESSGLFQRMLELCKNLNHLAIRSSLDYNDTAWLLQKYPKLEHLAILPLTNEKLIELASFFELNTNVRNFMVDSDFLWINRNEIMQIKFDELFIYLSNDVCYVYNESKLAEYCGMLNKWYANGVYRRLHIFGVPKQQIIDKLATIKGFVGFKSMGSLSEGIDFTPLTNLEIFHFDNITIESLDMIQIAEHLKNITEISFYDANFNTILPFIQHSPKLKKIIIKYMDSDDDRNELSAFNRERKKLYESMGHVSKVSIYIPETQYLKIRMESVTMYLDLVEIRPFEQFDKILFYDY